MGDAVDYGLLEVTPHKHTKPRIRNPHCPILCRALARRPERSRGQNNTRTRPRDKLRQRTHSRVLGCEVGGRRGSLPRAVPRQLSHSDLPQPDRAITGRRSALRRAADERCIAAEAHPPEVITALTCHSRGSTRSPSALTTSCFPTPSSNTYSIRCARWGTVELTAANGIGLHQVDFRDHRSYDRPLEYLLMDEFSFVELLQQERGGCGNRLRPHQMDGLFRRAGFSEHRFRAEYVGKRGIPFGVRSSAARLPGESVLRDQRRAAARDGRAILHREIGRGVSLPKPRVDFRAARATPGRRSAPSPGSRMPKMASSLPQSSREFFGRAAALRYSEEGIGTIEPARRPSRPSAPRLLDDAAGESVP